jgi:flagellar basal-body rod protein FlgG
MSVTNAFDIARTGLGVQEKLLAVHAQNLSAQSVDSYKRQYGVVYDLPYQDESVVGSPTSSQGTINPTGSQIGMGVRLGGVYRSFEQGDSIQTGEAFDLMIEGNGMYQVTRPDGTTAYTRVASFQKSPQGQLVTLTGYQLVPGITIPPTAESIQVSKDGQVAVVLAGQTNLQVIGQLQLSTFNNPNGLRPLGDSLFVETAASGTPLTGNPDSNQFGAIKQGYREASNVNMVEELTGMIQTEKIYQSILKIVKAGETMMSSATEIGRG